MKSQNSPAAAGTEPHDPDQTPQAPARRVAPPPPVPQEPAAPPPARRLSGRQVLVNWLLMALGFGGIALAAQWLS